MEEAGDKISLPIPDNSENALVTKLLKISESISDEKINDSDKLCGWQPKILLPPYDNLTELKVKTKNSATKENSRRWKDVSSNYDSNPYKEVEIPKKKSKKRTKFHPKRIEELSLPRKIRNKVALKNRSKILLPFSDNIVLNDDNINTITKMSKVALHYEKPEHDVQSFRTKAFHRTFSDFRVDISHLSHDEDKYIERTFKDLFSNPKSHSAGSIKPCKRTNQNTSSFLVKTRANVDHDWDLLPMATEITTDEISEKSVSNSKQADLPLPRVKIKNNKANTTYKYVEDMIPQIHLPSIPSKTKRGIGSVTAITQGNLKVGIKTNSIRKIHRKAPPPRTVILPKLSGSRVEVPLLPRSPDFLRRIA